MKVVQKRLSQRPPQKRPLRQKRPRETQTSKICPPCWLWLLAGILLGVFGAFLYDSFREITPQQAVQSLSTTSAKSEKPTSVVKSESPEFRFEFHDVLPNAGVQVPYSPLKPETNNTNIEVSPSQMKVLQVGSFRELQSAEGLKNHLSSLGIQAFIQAVTLNNDEQWHRVRVGPFQDLTQLNQVSTQLSTHNIAFDILKW